MEMIIRQTASEVLARDLDQIARTAKASLDALAGKDVLITGGAGFLGYELVHLLAGVGVSDGREPVRLTVYDNFIRGRKPWLEALARRHNVKVVQHDITRPLPADAPLFSYIVHAASIASPTFYRQYPIETIDANVNGLRYLLDHMRERQVTRPVEGMLFFSTSEIYGDPAPDAIPTPETYRGFVSCTGPRACYDESKRLGETMCVNFAQQYGCQVTIARPFNNYGPGLDINDRRLLPDLARDIFQGKDIVLLSDGRATRTFCYIADALSGYLKILTHGVPGESYNIGTELPEISVTDFAAKIAEIGRGNFGYKGKVVHQASADLHYLTDNPNRRCPDIGKARSQVGYAPQVGLDEGLQRALVWYRENL
jgi:UDP-glucuronate decarboxylase